MAGWGNSNRVNESNNNGWETRNNDDSGWHNQSRNEYRNRYDNNEEDSTTHQHRKHNDCRENFNKKSKKKPRELGISLISP